MTTTSNFPTIRILARASGGCHLRSAVGQPRGGDVGEVWVDADEGRPSPRVCIEDALEFHRVSRQ